MSWKGIILSSGSDTVRKQDRVPAFLIGSKTFPADRRSAIAAWRLSLETFNDSRSKIGSPVRGLDLALCIFYNKIGITFSGHSASSRELLNQRGGGNPEFVTSHNCTWPGNPTFGWWGPVLWDWALTWRSAGTGLISVRIVIQYVMQNVTQYTIQYVITVYNTYNTVLV